MILILCGYSGSGKTTIRDALAKDYQYTKVLTYTDRPIRINEEREVDYHFVSPEFFDQIDRANCFVETTSYNVANSDRPWRYGTGFDAFQQKGYKNVIILNPEGIKAIPKSIRDKACVCYVESDPDDLVQRLIKRGDDEREIQRRLVADHNDFQDIYGYADIRVENANDIPVDTVILEIDVMYKNWIGKRFKAVCV